MEIFKKSKKSICHRCINLNEICVNRVHMSCGTDSKIGMAFVEMCGSLNREIVKNEYKANIIAVKYSADSRIEMMGGGH